jgi:hypothetical protein
MFPFFTVSNATIFMQGFNYTFLHLVVINSKGKGIPTFGSQMAARLSAMRAGRFLSQENSWYSFLLEAESTPGPSCGWKY